MVRSPHPVTGADRDQALIFRLVSVDMTQQNLMLLFVGAVLLALIGVVIDRLNFPQKPFRPKTTMVEKGWHTRDRTGAHITELAEGDTTDSANAELQE